MGNHIFIIDSEAIGKYISGLIDKKFKSSREFCHRWLKENNELTDNELKNEESIQNRANKLSQIKKGKRTFRSTIYPYSQSCSACHSNGYSARASRVPHCRNGCQTTT